MGVTCYHELKAREPASSAATQARRSGKDFCFDYYWRAIRLSHGDVGASARALKLSRILSRSRNPLRQNVNISLYLPETENTWRWKRFDSFSEKPTTHPLSRSAKNCGVGWQDIADVVAFLISEQGKWITGHNIQACGGVVM